ncbi:DMT family transporter [Agrobacterium tumefaciens]|uniref:DMT family transporter n=1 Tax=Agrobacterium tumefaciens TaxID=358 RepID=UPI001574B951|nr:DMT family transporter [Agrobacterium tumefaciens]
MYVLHANRTLPSRFWTVAPSCFLLLWASGFVFLKIGLAYADPLTFLALRYLCVVGLLVPIALWLRPTFPTDIRGWGASIGIGLLLQSGYFGFTYLSLRAGLTAGSVAPITCQQPIIVGLAAPLLAQERVSALRWVGLLLGVLGASLVLIANSGNFAVTVWGATFGVMALLSIAGSTMLEKRFNFPLHPVSANIIQCSVGLIVIGSLATVLEPMHIDWTWQFVVSLTYLVLGASLAAITLLLAMIRRGEASRVSALFFLVPPLTAALAFIFIGEKLSVAALPGMGMVAVGIYMVMRKS